MGSTDPFYSGNSGHQRLDHSRLRRDLGAWYDKRNDARFSNRRLGVAASPQMVARTGGKIVEGQIGKDTRRIKGCRNGIGPRGPAGS